MKIVDAKDLEAMSPVFKGAMGQLLARLFLRVTAIDKFNKVLDQSGAFSGPHFTSSFLKDLGVRYVVGNAEELKNLPEGAFITVSNHPYGGLDGAILIDLIAAIRKDYKFMVNKILSLISTMKDNFISVAPLHNDSQSVAKASILGIREVILRLQNGHPVGFFPSGAISDFSIRNLRIQDREWQKSIINLIHSVKVPIVPIRFFDINSRLFYFLGLIHWKIRLMRLPREVFNKTKQQIRVGIGKIISVEQQEQMKDPEELGIYLRKSVYEMPLPSSFIPRNMLRL